MEQQEFKYFAFISYNSRDTEWGKKVQFYSNIGYVHGYQGDYPKALKYFTKSFVVQGKMLGTEPKTVVVMRDDAISQYHFRIR